MESSPRPPRWYQGLTRTHWILLAVASAGWVFDVYEGQLFTNFMTPMIRELTGDAVGAVQRQGNIGFATFLLGGAAGGLFFGVLGDRHGRLRVMAATILVYSIFSALTAFVSSVWQVQVLRFLVGVGTGGEWAVAAALVAETFPARSRASASGLFHASSVLGTVLASATGMIFVHPGSWRAAFLVGLVPALLVLAIRTISMRGEARRSETARPSDSGRLSELLGDPHWRIRALVGLGLATVGLSTFWGSFAWGKDLAGLAMDPSTSVETRQSASSLAYLLMNFTGGLIGLLSFAPISERLGRRGAFAFYHVGAGIMVPLTFLGHPGYNATVALLCVMAFFVLGMHAGYAIYFPELFPTRLRATGASFCFNMGRILGAVFLVLRGELGARLGMPKAATAISLLFWVGLALLWFTPETRGHELPE